MRMPWYNEIAHIPLFIWDPRLGVQGERRTSLTQTIDLGPTVLDFFDVDVPKDMLGKPLRHVMEDDTPHREAALYGMFGGHVNVTDGRYTYMRAPIEENSPLYHYTLMPSHLRRPFSTEELKHMTWHAPLSFTKNCPVMRIPSTGPVGRAPDLFETKLFDIENDRDQTQPLDEPAVEAQIIDKLVRVMADNAAPLEQYERLGIRPPKI
jgi:hypothetical protein